MRGSIIRRGKSYSVVVDLGRDPETGKRRQKWHSGYRTKREAEAALADLVGSVNRGTYVAPSKQSVRGVRGRLAGGDQADPPRLHALLLHAQPAAPRGTSPRRAEHDRGGCRGAERSVRAAPRKRQQDQPAGSRGRTVAPHRALYPHDRAPHVQGRGALGTPRPQPGRRSRPAQGRGRGEPGDRDVVRRAARRLPRRDARAPAVCGIPSPGHHRHATR